MPPMITVGTLRGVLLGNHEAMGDAAASRMALGVGAVLVLSAALARNWDRADLTDTWLLRLVSPFAVSLATSLVIFLAIYSTVWGWQFLRGYRAFLTIYWLTAPLAWLYGFPIERWISPEDAVTANVWALVIVSSWRVWLIVRAASTLTGCSGFTMLGPVMVGCEAVLFLAASRVHLDEIASFQGVIVTTAHAMNFMGGVVGVPLAPGSGTVLGTATLIIVLAVLTAPLWLVGWARAAFFVDPVLPFPKADPGRNVTPGLWALAAASVAVWGALAIGYQM